MNTLRFEPVITSLLDTDLYKFTMLQVMLHHNPAALGETEFVCRNTPTYPLARLQGDLEQQIAHLCSLRLLPEELDYLAARSYFQPDFIEFLRLFHLQRQFLTIRTEGDRLVIRAQGPLLHISLFEVFVLAIVNELYCRAFDPAPALALGRERLQAKVAQLRQAAQQAQASGLPVLEMFDFGTRRRYSRAWHEEVVATLAAQVPQSFRGTSNVDLARRLGLTPIGTMAHEHLQKHQGLGGQLKNSQKAALEEWVQEYRGELGIALTDVIGIDAFLRDFDRYFALLFDGVRHDSGDPYVWGDKILAHYQRLRIDPRTKRLVFSDGLDVPRALALWRYFAGRVQTGFGIGTSLTNDVGLVPLHIVMKLVRVNQQPVAKISDAPGKTLCPDPVFLRYLCQVFQVSPALEATPC